MTTALSPWAERVAALPVAFAQVREDALLDLRLAARAGPSARVLMVASGGCTAAALASAPQVGSLHVVDPNPAQIALTRLKLRLLQTCGPDDRLALLGHTPLAAPRRAAGLASHLRALDLAPEVLGPPEFVAQVGPDHAGRYERLFVELREALADQRDDLDAVLGLRDVAEQARRVAPDTGLGRALDEACDRVLSLDNLTRLFGAAATANRVEPFARHFARRTRHVLATLPAASNPYLWQMWTGRFPAAYRSPWLTAAAPQRFPELRWTTAAMDTALRAAPGGQVDLVHLSNILDWLDPASARRTLDLAWTALRPGGWVIIRQLNSAIDVRALGSAFAWDPAAAELHAADRSFFYRDLHVGRKP
jgi:S-adenosylmethionine-diacylglycerol 3-amino-3-carboxypropyl transferase